MDHDAARYVAASPPRPALTSTRHTDCAHSKSSSTPPNTQRNTPSPFQHSRNYVLVVSLNGLSLRAKSLTPSYSAGIPDRPVQWRPLAWEVLLGVRSREKGEWEQAERERWAGYYVRFQAVRRRRVARTVDASLTLPLAHRNSFNKPHPH